ncbi:MAG: Maltose transport system permease protein MalF [Actinomycetota bacterium]|jgi:arabinogalactan oligomer/maltooligosaccharide transport system permease protein
MAESRAQRKHAKRLSEGGARTTRGWIITILTLGIVDAMVGFVLWTLMLREMWLASAVTLIVAAVINWIYLRRGGLPAKYLAPGVLFLIAFQMYVLFFSSYIAFTNYADDHNGDIKMAVSGIQSASYVPVESVDSDLSYGYYVCYLKDADQQTWMMATKYEVRVTDPETGETAIKNLESYIGGADAETQALRPVEGDAACDGVDGSPTGFVAVAPDGFEPFDPTVLDADQANALGAMRVWTSTEKDQFLMAEDLMNGLMYSERLEFINPNDDWSNPHFREISNGNMFYAAKDGYFRLDMDGDKVADADGEKASSIGWRVEVGFENFQQIFSDERLRAPLLKIISWTFIFAGATVLSTFVVGLGIALLFNDDRMKGKKIYRSIMILPYAFPAFLSAYVWRGLFNTRYGFINNVILGQPSGEAGVNNTPWLEQEGYARLAVLLVNLWLGFPYMFLITTGALQAIPAELTESATIDGASSWQILRLIKMPLLLVSLAPLLISSYAFNFNNFTLIYLLTGGGPNDTSSGYNAGGTDILITFVYKIAFSTGSGRDYGLASAFSILIFIVIGGLSLISFRRTKTLEEMN